VDARSTPCLDLELVCGVPDLQDADTVILSITSPHHKKSGGVSISHVSTSVICLDINNN
jgi:hypothetical protein